MFSIHTKRLARFSSALQQTKKKHQQLRGVHQQLIPLIKTHTNVHILQELQHNLVTLERDLSNTLTHFQTGIAQYTKVEQTLLDAARIETNVRFQQPVKTSIVTHENKKSDNRYITTQKNKVTHHTHTSVHKDKSVIDYAKNGICGGIYSGFKAYQVQARKKYAYAQGSVGATLGSVHGALDVRGTLFDKGKLSPTLHVDSKVGASIADFKGQAGIGNTYVNAIGEASLAVGAITGHAKAVLNKNEVSVKAEVGAAAVRGEIKGTLSIFGMKISAVGIGELGAAGVSAEFSSKKGEFEFGGKASFLAGLGFKIKVTY